MYVDQEIYRNFTDALGKKTGEKVFRTAQDCALSSLHQRQCEDNFTLLSITRQLHLQQIAEVVRHASSF